MSTEDDSTVELRRREPSPITLIPVRRQSHLPSISEIHHLRLSLNEKLMHSNHGGTSTSSSSGKRSKPPFVTAPSSPILSSSTARKLAAVSSPPSSTLAMTNNSAPAEEYNDLHMFLIREHYTSQKSFVHSNHENEMRRVQELRAVKQQLVACSNGHAKGSGGQTKEASSALFKRNSFLRNSWNVIMRQSIRLSSSATSSATRSSWESGKGKGKEKGNGNGNECEKSDSAATGRVPRTPTNSKCSSDSEFFGNRFSFQSLRRKKETSKGSSAAGGGHKRNSSTSSFFSNR